MLCRIGEVEIWRVLESICPFAPLNRFFPDLGADALERHRPLLEPHGLRRDPATGDAWIVLPIQAFLLRTPRHLILVDACVGNDKSLPKMAFWNRMRSGRFMASLAAAGASVEEVTHVMCTHLHVDHVGWTTSLRDGRWVPTFPNAKVLATQADLDHARTAADRWPDGTAGLIWRESIEPLIDDARFEVVPPDHQIDPLVRLRPTPGHTPGHVSVEIAAPSSMAPAAVAGGGAITGDLMHTPLQCRLPELSPSVDADRALAARTRRRFLENAGETGQLVLGTHFPLPSVGHVRPEGDAFRWEPLLG